MTEWEKEAIEDVEEAYRKGLLRAAEIIDKLEGYKGYENNATAQVLKTHYLILKEEIAEAIRNEANAKR